MLLLTIWCRINYLKMIKKEELILKLKVLTNKQNYRIINTIISIITVIIFNIFLIIVLFHITIDTIVAIRDLALELYCK